MTDNKENFDKKSINPEDILNVFANGRIGEIITTIIGNGELQKRFEECPEFQAEEFEGKPSGIIALDLGIVNKDVKNALLVAQAAARTHVLAMKAKSVVEQRGENVASGAKLGNELIVPMDDPIFKFVGSEGDLMLLQSAQATWQIAQDNLNAEVGYTNESIDNPGAVYYSDGSGVKGADTLTVFAKQYMDIAAKIMADNGFDDASNKMQASTKSMKASNDIENMSPAKVAYEILHRAQRACQNANIALNGDYWNVPEESVKLTKKLAVLADQMVEHVQVDYQNGRVIRPQLKR